MAFLLCLAAFGSVACSSNDPGAGAAGGGGATAGAGGGGGSAGLGSAGSAAGAAASEAGGGQTSAAGAGGIAGAPSHADAIAAIKSGCQTAVQACPQVTIDQCVSSNDSQLLADSAPCFGAQLSVFQCVAKLPTLAFQCVANFAKPSAPYCSDENAALQSCYTAHPAM
ncbi:MAG: hypothetical protein ABI548_21850 [Polyangiaceae bacterium]